jgi:hypothetical protein
MKTSKTEGRMDIALHSAVPITATVHDHDASYPISGPGGIAPAPRLNSFPRYDGSEQNPSVWPAITSEATLLPELTGR